MLIAWRAGVERSGEATGLAPIPTADGPWAGTSLVINQRWERYPEGYRGSTTINSLTQFPSQKGTTPPQEVSKTIKVHGTCVRHRLGGVVA